MKTTIQPSTFLIFLLLISLGYSIKTASLNPVCPARAQLSIAAQVLSILPFDHRGIYYQPATFSTNQLFVQRGGDGNTNFKLITYDNSYKTPVTKQCDSSSTSGISFEKLIDEYMIIKNPTTLSYYMYKYDSPQSNGKILPVKLNYPTEIVGSTVFKPFYYKNQDKKLLVLISNQTVSGIFTYQWPSIITAGTEITPQIRGQTFSYFMQAAYGTQWYFYDYAIAKFQKYSPSSWSTDDSVGVINKKTSFYSLRYNFFAIVMYDDNKKLSGTFKILYQTTQQQSFTFAKTTPTQTSYKIYSDRMSNIVILNNNYFVWVNIDYQGTYAKATSFETFDISKLKEFSLSGNKAVMLFDTKMQFYQIKNSNIQFIFQKPVTQDFSTGSWKVNLVCMCKQIKRFSCFGSNLNCLVLKKAERACNRENDMNPLI